MTLPATPTVTVRFGPGATFGPIMQLGSATQGILGTAVLGTAASEYVDVTNIQRIAIRRGRDRVLDTYSAGTATIQFLDTAGVWNPTNTSSYGTKIKPFNQIQIRTTYLSTNYELFTGYVSSWDYDWQPGTGVSQVTIQAIDAFRLFGLANITTVSGATAGETPGARLEKILDEVTWPESYRDIDTGSVTVQADPGTERTVLEAAQAMETAELGAFFIAGDGKATFLSRSEIANISSQPLASIAQFRDTAGTYARYQTIDVSYDDNDLANVVSVTRQGGTTQTVSNAASVLEYYQRSLSRDGLLLETDTQALNQANMILGYRDEIQQVVQSISTDLSRDATTAATCLALELNDPVYVVRTPVAGPAISLRLSVQNISHDISPASWRTTIGTAVPLATAFVLGSSDFGILGTSTL